MFNFSFRPTQWDDYIGQENIKANLDIFIQASQKEKRVLDHMMISGPSGIGKTSLGYLISHILKTKIHILQGTNLQKPSDLISCLTQLKEHEIIFIDEIHAISKEVNEILYPVLEDNCLNIILGKDYNAKHINLKLPKFTLIGATTFLHRLTPPFRNRFRINFQMQDYSQNQISQILQNCAKKANLILPSARAFFLANYTRANPRLAVNLFLRIYDYVILNETTIVTQTLLEVILKKLQIHQDGLESSEINYLVTLAKVFNNQPTGIETLCQILSEPLLTITSLVEPFLIKRGYLKRTTRGRILTKKALLFVATLKSELL